MGNNKIKREKQSKSNDAIDIPIEHQQIVLERMTKARTNPERLLDWDEVFKKL